MKSVSKNWIPKMINLVLNPDQNACRMEFEHLQLNPPLLQAQGFVSRLKICWSALSLLSKIIVGGGVGNELHELREVDTICSVWEECMKRSWLGINLM